MSRLDDRDCEECPTCGCLPTWGDCRCWDDGSRDHRTPRAEEEAGRYAARSERTRMIRGAARPLVG